MYTIYMLREHARILFYCLNMASRKKNQWSTAQLHAAIRRVKTKELSLRQAAVLYGIPRSTLSDHVHGKSTKRYGGPPTALSITEEAEVVVACQVLAELGFPMNSDYVNAALRDYLVKEGKPHPFGKSGAPGRNWWCSFLKRHPELAQRKPQHLTKARAEAANPEVLDEWFSKVQSLFSSTKLQDLDETEIAKRLWNCDETGFCTAVASKTVLAKRGAKAVHEVGGGSGREYITVLCKCLHCN